MAMQPTRRDIRVAQGIADEIRDRASARTPWRRVATLRYQFEMEGVRFSRVHRERMQSALEKSGLVPDPSITEVNRGDTVRLRVQAMTQTQPKPDQFSRASPESERPAGSLPTDRRIFISYRRLDCQPQANGLNDGLRQRIPASEIFMDVDTIPPGTDFEEFIRNWIENSDILLVLIGDDWLETNPEGRRRIDSPEDFVRLEIRAALEQGKVVLPVLVEGAEMPSSSDLPSDISRLARIQSIELSDKRWRTDVSRLAEVIGSVDVPRPAPPTAIAPSRPPEPVPAAPPRPVTVEYPSRFTDRWFREHVPSMDRPQLVEMTAELTRRSWSPGEIRDYVYCYAVDPVAPPLITRPGDPAAAKAFDIPGRVHRAWLARTVPDLDDDQLAVLLGTLRQRGWTEGEIEDLVLAHRS